MRCLSFSSGKIIMQMSCPKNQQKCVAAASRRGVLIIVAVMWQKVYIRAQLRSRRGDYDVSIQVPVVARV